MEGKLFIGFGILAIFSGIYLIIQQDYLIGISGSIVGIWLTFQNLKKMRSAQRNQILGTKENK